MEKVDSIIILGININHKGLVQLHWSIQNSSCTLNVPMFALDIEVFFTQFRAKSRKYDFYIFYRNEHNLQNQHNY